MARLLAIPEAHGIGLAVAAFAWALDMAPDGDLSGQLIDDEPAEMVAAAVGWTSEPEKLYRAMVRVGFVEEASGDITDGFDRIRGLNRYESVLVEREKDRARKAASRLKRPAMSAGSPPEVRRTLSESTRKTQTQTHTQREALTLSSKASDVADAPPVPGGDWVDKLFKPGAQPVPSGDLWMAKRGAKSPKPPKPKAEKPPPDPRHAPMVGRLTEAFRKTTGLTYGFAPRDAKDVASLLAMGTDDEIETRWVRALRNTGFPVVRSLGELFRNWNHFAMPGVTNGKAPVRAEDIPKDAFAVKGEIHDF